MSAFQGRRFPGPPSAEAVETPCIGICNMDRTRGICRGCGRLNSSVATFAAITGTKARSAAITNQAGKYPENHIAARPASQTPAATAKNRARAPSPPTQDGAAVIRNPAMAALA